MGTLLGQAKIDLTNAADQLEEWAARGSRERARVEMSERRRRPPGEAATPTFADARSYTRHLNKGGARDPAFEATQGWGKSG